MSTDVIDQYCTQELKFNTLKSDVFFDSKINTGYTNKEMHTAEVGKTVQIEERDPRIIKNEIFKYKINILQSGLNFAKDNLPNTSVLEEHLCSFSEIKSNISTLSIEKDLIFSSTLATSPKPSVPSINDVPFLTLISKTFCENSQHVFLDLKNRGIILLFLYLHFVLFKHLWKHIYLYMFTSFYFY